MIRERALVAKKNILFSEKKEKYQNRTLPVSLDNADVVIDEMTVVGAGVSREANWNYMPEWIDSSERARVGHPEF